MLFQLSPRILHLIFFVHPSSLLNSSSTSSSIVTTPLHRHFCPCISAIFSVAPPFLSITTYLPPTVLIEPRNILFHCHFSFRFSCRSPFFLTFYLPPCILTDRCSILVCCSLYHTDTHRPSPSSPHLTQDTLLLILYLNRINKHTIIAPLL